MRLTFKAAYARLLAAAQGHDLVAKWLASIRKDTLGQLTQRRATALHRTVI